MWERGELWRLVTYGLVGAGGISPWSAATRDLGGLVGIATATAWGLRIARPRGRH